MSDERAEMQRAAINGVLDRVEMCLTSHEEARGTDCTATEADRVLEAADVIRRIRGGCLSPAESVPCGPVVDMEKAREGLRALRAVIGQLSSQDHERWRREATDVIVDLIAAPGALGEAIASEVRFALRAF